MIQYSEESLESRWYREHSIRIHMKRLQDIKDRSSSLVQSPARFYSVNRRRVEKNVFKHHEMIRQNIMMYDKLTQISERKQNKSEAKGPKSLNISIRKKEADRIIQDNFEFVKRLTEKESNFSVSRFKRDYDMQEKYKSSISRHNLHERLKKITDSELKLPPIFQESSKGGSMSRVSENSKSGLKRSKNSLKDESPKNIGKVNKGTKLEKADERSGGAINTAAVSDKVNLEIKTDLQLVKEESDLKGTNDRFKTDLKISTGSIESDSENDVKTPESKKHLENPESDSKNDMKSSESKKTLENHPETDPKSPKSPKNNSEPSFPPEANPGLPSSPPN